jgi:hypothetical protein
MKLRGHVTRLEIEPQTGHFLVTVIARASIVVISPSIETRSTRNPGGMIAEGPRAVVMALIPLETSASRRRNCIKSESEPSFDAD